MSLTAVTLICNPQAPVLDAALVEAVNAALAGYAAAAPRRRTLSAQTAEEWTVAVPSPDRAALQSMLAGHLDGRPIDIAIQPAENREKKLLIADMDSTIIEQECIDELADFIGKRHIIAEITERAMRGEVDFETSLAERVAMLKGLPAQRLEDAFRDRITLTPGARALARTMGARGAATAIVSGGFTFFTERVAAAAGFARHHANELVIENQRLTGAVARPLVDRHKKESTLRQLAEEFQLRLDETLAVGDGANDLAMLGAAGLGVAFRAKPAVAAAADIAIRHGDLTALLFLQGIAREQFVED